MASPSTTTKLVKFIEDKNCELIQTNGQRVYTPKDVKCNYQVPFGCEVFVGRLPSTMLEDELVPIFESVAPLHRLRLMMDFTGKNRGYCFVTYRTPDGAADAVRTLHNSEVRPGRRIGVYKSVDNKRLFVGGLPLHINKDDVAEALGEYVEGIMEVIMYKSHWNPEHNRGFAFVDFEDHRMAAMARRRFSPGSLILWGSPIMVDWAEPLPDVDPQIMSSVTILYIRNIDVSVGRDDFRSLLEEIIDISAVVRLHKTLDYAFVHFTDRTSAEIAYEQIKKATSHNLDAMWARPSRYSKAHLAHNLPQHFCTSLPPRSRRFVQNRLNIIKTLRSTDSNNLVSQLEMMHINPSAQSQPVVPPPSEWFQFQPVPSCIPVLLCEGPTKLDVKDTSGMAEEPLTWNSTLPIANTLYMPQKSWSMR